MAWAQRQLAFPQLWTFSRGRGVNGAVIDTGVNPGQAFGGRLIAGGDLVTPQESTHGLVDCDGHGTLVAALVAAGPDPSSGFSGVAPDARVISIRQDSGAYALADPDDRRDSARTPESLADAIDLAVNLGAHVINISAAQCGPAAAVVSPGLQAAVEPAIRRDVVVVAAAGKVGSSPGCTMKNQPDHPIRTGGTARRRGRRLDRGVDGRRWRRLAVLSRGSLGGPHGVGETQGTGFAAPYVTGVVALVRARYPQLSAEQVIRLVGTANPPAGVGGFTIAAGHGEVDPRRALTAVLPSEAGVAPASTSPEPGALRIPPAHSAVPHPAKRSAAALSVLTAAGEHMAFTRIALRRIRVAPEAAHQGNT